MTAETVAEPTAYLHVETRRAMLPGTEHSHVHSWEGGQRSFRHFHPMPTDASSPDAAHPHRHSNGWHSHPHGHTEYEA